MDSLFGNVYRLFRRHWYVAVGVVLLGAMCARALDSADVTSMEILHVRSVEDVAKTLDLQDVPGAPSAAVAAQAPGDFKRSPDFVGLTGSFLWDAVARSLTVTITGGDSASVAGGASRVRNLLIEKIEKPVGDVLALAIKDLDARIKTLSDSAAALDKSAGGLAANDPARASLLSTAGDLRNQAAKATMRQSSLTTLNAFVPSIVTSETPTVTKRAPGIATYVAGIMVACVLLVLGACSWVLADRRIRRRIDLDRAAPGVRNLGLVGQSLDADTGVDSVVVASVKAFVRDAHLTSVVLFGVPRGSSPIALLVAALQDAVDVSVVESAGDAADTVRHELSEAIGYIAVVRWGKTSEDQLSSAIADVRSVGGLAVATILVGVPERDRSWVGAAATESDSFPAEGL